MSRRDRATAFRNRVVGLAINHCEQPAILWDRRVAGEVLQYEQLLPLDVEPPQVAEHLVAVRCHHQLPGAILLEGPALAAEDVQVPIDDDCRMLLPRSGRWTLPRGCIQENPLIVVHVEAPQLMHFGLEVHAGIHISAGLRIPQVQNVLVDVGATVAYIFILLTQKY